MAATAAASVFALGSGNAPERREGLWISAAGAAPIVLAGVLCMLLLLRHPGPSAGNERAAFRRALERSPGDAWLLREYGRFQLSRGDYEGAYRSFGGAVTLSPYDVTGKIDLATAAFLKDRRFGRPAGGADLIEKMPVTSEAWVSYYPGKDHLLRAFYELDAGLAGRAGESVRLARQARSEVIRFKLKSDSTAAREDRARMEDTYLIEAVLPGLLDSFPGELREKLGPAFLKLYFGDAGLAAAGGADLTGGPVVSGKGSVRAGGSSKKLSDEAVELITSGDLAGAKSLLTEAVKADGDNYEARMNLCFLAAKTGDLRLGEENCGEAVFLAAKPPRHSITSKDRLPAALFSRGEFYFRAGDKAKACQDMRRATEAAPSGWPPARKALTAACGK